MRRTLSLLISLSFLSLPVWAQTFPKPNYFQRVFVRPAAPRSVPGPDGLDTYVVDGKLRLGLQDAVRLTLANNTDVRLSRLQVDLASNAITKSYGPFDPVLTSSFSPQRSTSPATSTLQGAATPSSLSQVFQSQYSQQFATGMQYSVSLNATRSSSNSSFASVNPSISSGLQFSISQPLLRNRGVFPNRAPITIAQRNLKQSRSGFEAQVSDTVLRAINSYWDVVQSRENLKVLQNALDLAEATYKQNKRALELGALPPLDIYRSESQVAQRKLQLIQAEYQLKQAEDEFRRNIGVDLDSRVAALDLDLTEPVDPPLLRTMDIQEALQTAMQSRPELASLQEQLAIDDINLRLSHNSMQPDLNLSTFYTTNGVGGTQFDDSGAVVARTGFADALDQLSGFNFPTYGFNLQLRLPLRNRSAEADMGSAVVSKQRSLYQLRQRQQAITLEVKNSVHQLEEAKLSIEAAKLSRDLAQKNLEAEQRKYELGANTIFFVLDAQNQLAQAEQSLVQAQISYQRGSASLDRDMGKLLEANRVQLRN